MKAHVYACIHLNCHVCCCSLLLLLLLLLELPNSGSDGILHLIISTIINDTTLVFVRLFYMCINMIIIYVWLLMFFLHTSLPRKLRDCLLACCVFLSFRYIDFSFSWFSYQTYSHNGLIIIRLISFFFCHANYWTALWQLTSSLGFLWLTLQFR